MAITASKLKALVEVDGEAGKAELRTISQALKWAAKEADKDAKAMGDAMGKGVKQGADKGKQEAQGLLDGIKAVFAGNALWDITKGIGSGIAGAIKGAFSAVAGVGQDAFSAVKDYESLSQSLTQLTATQLVDTGVTEDMAQALQMASKPAQDLIGWVERLAVLSPFDSTQINGAVQMAMGFQFAQTEAKRLTQDVVDYLSAAGKSPEVLDRIMLSLGQMNSRGKVTGEELRELALAGLPVTNILAKAFGTTRGEMEAMVSEGAVPAGQAIQALEEYLEKNFKGAAERTANTWNGLISSLKDAKGINLRELFGGVFEAIKPQAVNLTGVLLSDEFKGRLREVGQELGAAVTAGIAQTKGTVAALDQAGLLGGLKQIVDFARNGDTKGAVGDLFNSFITGAIDAGIHIAYFAQKVAVNFTEAVEIGKTMATSIVQLATWIDGKLAPLMAQMEGLARFSQLSTQYGGGLSGTAMAAGIMAGEGVFDKLRGAQQESDSALERAKNSSNELLQILAGGAEQIGTAVTDANTKIDALNQAEKQAVDLANGQQATARRIYDNRLADTKRNTQEPDMPGGAQFNQWQKEQEAAAVVNTMQPKVDNVFQQAGTKAGQKAGDAFSQALDKAISKAQSVLENGINVSMNLGKLGPEPGAAGSDSWAENIFRIQDVAMNLGTPHEGKDTRKWYQQFFGGMGFEDAANQAKGIVTKFQAGMLMDPQVMQYLDVGKARNLISQQAEGERQTADFAKLVGADAGVLGSLLGAGTTGKDLAGNADIENAMSVLKGDMVNAAGKLGQETPTLMEAFLMGTGSATDKNPSGAGVTFSGAFLDAVSKDLLANSDKYEAVGSTAWDKIETGFVNKAMASTVFAQAIDDMVENSIKRYLPNNK